MLCHTTKTTLKDGKIGWGRIPDFQMLGCLVAFKNSDMQEFGYPEFYKNLDIPFLNWWIPLRNSKKTNKPSMKHYKLFFALQFTSHLLGLIIWLGGWLIKWKILGHQGFPWFLELQSFYIINCQLSISILRWPNKSN